MAIDRRAPRTEPTPAPPVRVAHFHLLDRRETYAVTVGDGDAWAEPASHGRSGLAELALSTETWELLVVGSLRLTDALAARRVVVVRNRAAAQRFARSFDAESLSTDSLPELAPQLNRIKGGMQ